MTLEQINHQIARAEQQLARLRSFRENFAVETQREALRVAQITTACAGLWGIAPEALASRCRTQPCVDARFAAIFLLRQKTLLSTPAIGRIIRRDHTGVLYGQAQAENWMRCRVDFAAKVRKLEARFSS